MGESELSRRLAEARRVKEEAERKLKETRAEAHRMLKDELLVDNGLFLRSVVREMHNQSSNRYRDEQEKVIAACESAADAIRSASQLPAECGAPETKEGVTRETLVWHVAVYALRLNHMK
jgi:hypothetical protein